MSNEISKYDNQQMAVLKSQIAPRCSDVELEYFLGFCRAKNLDPFARQVYAIKRGDKMTIQTSIDGLRSIANRSGSYAPGDESWEFDDNGALQSATVSVRKLMSGHWLSFSATAFFAEYKGETPLWGRMPRTMLAKCAEAKALRKGWPEELGGVYSDDEMDQAAQTISPPPQLIVQNQTPKPDVANMVILTAAFAERNVSVRDIEAFIGGDIGGATHADVSVLRKIYKIMSNGMSWLQATSANSNKPETLEDLE